MDRQATRGNQSHTGSLGNGKINVLTISSGQECNAPQGGFRWVPGFFRRSIHTLCMPVSLCVGV